ncbi:MAG: translocation/assembly module TamB domain-containing protein [Cyclobacteriaceae bacterium]
MNGKLIIGNILTVLRKVILWTILTVLLSLVVAITLAQTAWFQNLAKDKVLAWVNEASEQQTNIDHIKVKWFDHVEIHGLHVLDYKDNVLLQAEILRVDYDLLNLIKGNTLSLDQIELGQGEFNLAKYDDPRGINLIEYIQSIRGLLPSKKPKDKRAESGVILLDHIYLSDLSFSFNNELSDSLEASRFDFAHFRFDIPEAIMSNFRMQADTITLNINSFLGTDQNSGFDVKSLATDFELSNRRIILDNLDLKLAQSNIREYARFDFTGLNDFSYFVDSVAMELNLNESYIHPDDLRYFASLDSSLVPLSITGHVKGMVGDLSVKDFTLKLTNNTYLKGSVDFLGLPNVEETFIILDVNSGRVRSSDLDQVLNQIPESIRELGQVSFDGQFSGFLSDFVAKANVSTRKGRLVSDLNLKLKSGWENASYSGRLKITNFNAGAFLNERELVQKVNFDGFIKGKGLTIENADFYTEAKLTNTGIYGYNYKEITAKGKFASRYFDGSLTVRDPNARLNATGSLNFAHRPEKLNVKANIELIDFKKLGLISRDLTLQSKVNFDLLGLNIDSLTSKASIRDLGVNYLGKKLDVDSISFSTENDGSGRIIKFTLPDISGKVEGNFYYTQLISDVRLISDEISRYFELTEEVDSMAFERTDFSRYQLDFEVHYGNLSPYLSFLNQDIYLSEDGKVEGTYYQRKNAMLTIYTDIDSVNYKGMGFRGNSFDINVIKDLDSLGVMAVANLASEKQHWGQVPSTSNLNLEAVWQDNKLTIYSNVGQPETNSHASINAVLDFFEDELVFKFLPSNVTVLGDRWYFNPENEITFKGNTIRVSQLDFNQLDQKILVNGIYADTAESRLEIEFDRFHLQNLNTIIPVKTQGILDGKFNLKKNVGDENFYFISDIQVDELIVDNYLVGNMSGSSEWDANEKRVRLDMEIVRSGINTIDLEGFFYPEADKDELDIDLTFEQANLKLFAPIFEGTVSGLEGLASGKVKVTGTRYLPMLDGTTNITDGRFTYDYLGVTYLFDGAINFNNEAINFSDITLRDRDNNVALLNGNLFHSGFKDIRPDITLSTNKFQFLNTTSRPGELYYGTAYASGSVKIGGTTSDLLIDADVRSEKGTKIYIPLEDGSNVEQKEYITFVDFSDTTRVFDLDEVIQNSITGVKLDLAMEVTSDAYVELIFDLRAGDIIRGSASGNLNLVLDTSGEFEMFGDVSITDGAYNFTSSIGGKTLISKEFSIQSGGTISWYGDPYKGVLNLRAIYRQYADILGLNPESTTETSSSTDSGSSRVPVLVALILQGEMLSPNIDFEISIDDSQGVPETDALAQLKQINDDEQELKRQVFSLLMLRKFSPIGNSLSLSGGSVTSISEFLTNQLSYYASQFNENLEVDLDLADMSSTEALNTLQLRLSYTFLDGRLRVSGGGGFNQTSTNTDDGNTFVGDWTVRYSLTSDGRLRARAFRQSDQAAGTYQQETGVSIQLVKSFDDLRNLLPKAFEKAQKRRESEEKKLD